MADLDPDSLRAAAYAQARNRICRPDCGVAECVKEAGCHCHREAERVVTAYLASEAERGMEMRPREATDAMLRAVTPTPHAVADLVNRSRWTAMWDAAKETPNAG